MFSGVLTAGNEVEVMSLIWGNDFWEDDTMKRVPFAMYTSRSKVQPGAWEIMVVSGSFELNSMGGGGSSSRIGDDLPSSFDNGLWLLGLICWFWLISIVRKVPSKGRKCMKSRMESAPTRMRTASLRDKPLRKGMGMVTIINYPQTVNVAINTH